jgi:hypothetical protein
MGRNFCLRLVFSSTGAILLSMKFAGPYPVDVWRSLAAAALILLPASNAQPQDSNKTDDTPYAPIVARNMFALLPIPPPDPDADKPPVDPPPKITPTGIMTIFGRDQALFRVANKPKPGQPAKDDAYVLAEGERQDDIEVVKINHTAGIITFNNHGAVQELPLVAAKETGGPAPGPGGGPGGAAPGVPRPGLMPTPSGGFRTGLNGFQGRALGGANSSFANNPGNPGAMGGGNNASAGIGGLNFGSGVSGSANGTTQSGTTASQITPEQQVILIEAQRMKYLQQGNKPLADILPPTPLTQQNMQENDAGAPPAP